MIYADSTTVLQAVASLVLAVGVLVGSYATFRNGRKVDAVKSIAKDVQVQVTTMNGLTMANLADNTEKRRAEQVPEHLRTDDEQEHADKPLATGQTSVAGVPKTEGTP